MGDRWSKVYLAVGVLVLLGYLWIGVRGKVFGGTDSRESLYWSSSSTGWGSGWGYVGGYSGGK